MNLDIKVTFMMMAYNAEDYIERAIQSVLDQSVPEVLLFVRNNGSTDRTGEIIHEYAKKDPRVVCKDNKVNGISDDGCPCLAWSWWCDEERYAGEYVSILDADDYLHPDFVKVMYAAAKENQSDIVIAGNYYVNEHNRVTGKRVPPRTDHHHLHENPDLYPKFYNNLRTWWGKLYQTEFFWNNYDAWDAVPPMTWNLDTLVVMNYLQKTEKVVSIDAPYYYFRIREDSTYRSREMEFCRFMEAYALYNENMKFIEKYGIKTTKNEEFIKRLHLGYMEEAVTVFLHNDEVPEEQKLYWIQEVLNDEITATYTRCFVNELWKMICPILEEIERNSKNIGIYKSYLVRLLWFVRTYSENKADPMNLVILYGCLCDFENRSHYGDILQYQNFEQLTQGEEKLIASHEYMKKRWYRCPEEMMDIFEETDWDDSVNAIIEEMDYMDTTSEEYELKLKKLERMSPFHSKTLTHKINYAIEHGQNELAAVLICSAHNIWPNEPVFQEIYKEL